MDKNINNSASRFLSCVSAKWPVFPAILFFTSCHGPKNITTFNRSEVIDYRDTTIQIPMVTERFDFESFQNDTVIQNGESTIQLVRDSTGGTIYYLRSAQEIRLDSVIRNVTIREIHRTNTVTQKCDSKFHNFTANFFKWTVSIVIFYAGMKAIFK